MSKEFLWFGRCGSFCSSLLVICLLGLGLLTPTPGAGQDISFRNRSEEVGVAGYQRQRSVTAARAEAVFALGTVTMNDFIGSYPIKPWGAPGVAILDFDGDGDEDIYVTNGPGAANSLYSNQLLESGTLSFLDVAALAGVTLTDQDSTGVCLGDTDNDGDPDLYVLGRSEANRFLENLGNGTFDDRTVPSGLGGGDRSSSSCAMGDVDGDGLLDIAVANNFDMRSNFAIFVEPFALNQMNELFLNEGGNSFTASGVESGFANVQEITWAIAMVDLDLDGDMDIVTASDNGGIPFAVFGGVDRGFLRFYSNDGGGRFTDLTAPAGLLNPGDWMGLAFGDFDGNGRLDIFGSNTGDYFEPFFGIPGGLGDQASRWFLQGENGVFSDPGVGSTVASPFGWGAAAVDYDNDGRTDLMYFGGLDAGAIVDSSNPGIVLHNTGGAVFDYDSQALAGSVDHSLRVEHGVAVGDLNRDGFPDIVSVASSRLGPNLPPGLIPYPFEYGSPFDGTAAFFPTFLPGENPGELIYSGASFPRGDLAVEISSGNGNRWVRAEALGTIGLTSAGVTNRSGIGAVFSFTPSRGNQSIQPVVGGGSYASQHSLAQIFGLGQARRGTLEVLWPGGVRNRLYGVGSREEILFPEIPCSFEDRSQSFFSYVGCLHLSLHELRAEGVLNNRQKARFFRSALLAFFYP